MIVLSGKGVFGAISMGKLVFYERKNHKAKRRAVSDIPYELERIAGAREQACNEMKELYGLALRQVVPETAMIFESHRMMLEDISFNAFITAKIKEDQVNAEYAVECASNHFYEMFSAMEDPYMQERAADIHDISNRLICILSNKNCSVCVTDEPSIIAAQDLVPSETVQLDRSKVLAFVTALGSETSHTAILAKDMNIPAVIGLGSQLKKEYNGLQAIVDGYSGQVYLEPDPQTIRFMRDKSRCEEEKKQALQEMIGLPNRSLDGQEIDVYANIANPADVDKVLANDAGGIGLMRSEFLYLGCHTFPSEERQFTAYKYVAQKMAGKTVIIRTMDIGADKKADYFCLPKEENPALGYRAIRICLEEPEIFRTQLRAIYRASAFGKIAILFPMITSTLEVDRALEMTSMVRTELANEGIDFDRSLKVGMMIETPAAALISDMLAEKVDFFSIGTNDLIQYTLAVDRQNQKLEWYHNSHHPAILRLIRMIVENAHKKGIKVGICGELAADLELSEEFLRIGVDELSMSPSMILPLRKHLREIDLRRSRH